jgi:hypothetical protein
LNPFGVPPLRQSGDPERRAIIRRQARVCSRIQPALRERIRACSSLAIQDYLERILPPAAGPIAESNNPNLERSFLERFYRRFFDALPIRSRLLRSPECS